MAIELHGLHAHPQLPVFLQIIVKQLVNADNHNVHALAAVYQLGALEI
jgi:hypothetical protein